MSHAPTAALSQRHQALQRALAGLGLDALVVTARPNVLYLTNFTGSAGLLVVTPERLTFVTDSRYVTAFHGMKGTPHECPGLELVTVEHSYDETLAELLAAGAATRIGVEAENLSVSRYNWLSSTLARRRALELVPTEGLVEQLRVVKDEYELSVLREAAHRLSNVTTLVMAEVRRGLTESELAQTIDGCIRKLGFERPAFDTIVASGPNAALPHARPGGRTISEGDLVVLDFGGVYASYCVDLTRTVSIGPAGGRKREVYDAVREAHDRAISAVAPGRSRFDIDAAARDVLASRGLAEAFGHGTGHGLGIEVHEAPRISRRAASDADADQAVATGMVFTIEPGAYLPGWGGVRIEDDVLVTGDGVEILTSGSTELLEF
ncbi:MAG TPA: Xaa-Pro peptidase family protein [Vicinamibacterales bacterium]|jgi:Xaa-Pro aminopeptidase